MTRSTLVLVAVAVIPAAWVSFGSSWQLESLARDVARPEVWHRALEFDDYEEQPEQCPATTTCPVVCVASATDCPWRCAVGEGVCSDGRCSVDCVENSVNEIDVNETDTNVNETDTDTFNGNETDDDDDDINGNENATDTFNATTRHLEFVAGTQGGISHALCPCRALPVPCPRVIDFYDECQSRFQSFYNDATTCEIQQAAAVPKVSFVSLWFVVCYAYFGGLAVAVMLWCYYNQILAPVPASTQPLPASSAAETTWTQTGYKLSLVGIVLDSLVELSFWIVQFLLLVTTLFFYTQQGAITRWKPVFEDEIQVLQAFIMVWMVGFFWCFAFRYPSTGVQSLFLRRCTLDEASYVAVVAPMKTIHTTATTESSTLGQAAACVWKPLDALLRTIFSYPYDQPGWETVFCPVKADPASPTRSILHRMRRYVFEMSNDETTASGTFIPCVMSVGTTFGDFMGQVGGLSQAEAQRRLGRQGPNVIPLTQPTMFDSLQQEFKKAFYLYQSFCIWAFANFWFFFMSFVYAFYRFVGALVVVYFQHKSDTLLYHLSNVEGLVEVLRDGDFVEISVENVVPGDVVVLKPGIVYCDMVVLKGFRVLVDESALTGEATPLLKAEIDPAMRHVPYVPAHHKVCTISAGTEILELDDSTKTLGLVMTTGSFTAKGELLTDVLSYQRQTFEYNDEVKVILFILTLEAVLMISLVFYFLHSHWVFSWFYGIYVLATVLPPLLPTVFVVSICVSAKRLQMKRISCQYPEAILLAGKVDAAFFDKTGTLTQFGLEFISFEGGASGDRIRIGMSVCHTLTSTSSGEIVGNQVDIASFQTTGATLKHEKGDAARISLDGEEYTVLKRFEFDSHRATQSVIVEDSKLKRQIYAKGSPEVIKSLCMETSIPADFDRTVQESAAAGIYQIAIAYRSYNLEMELADVRREDAEGCLTFGGFINFRNPIREETLDVLEEVEESEMTSAMITGDNVFTGIFIARESNMIKPNRVVVVGRLSTDNEVEWYSLDADAMVETPSPFLLSLPENEVDLAITGDAWNKLSKSEPKYVASIMNRIRVFGRCKPGDKVSVVASFVSHGYTTLMCGDGQNDCGCLKTAHVGVALSNAEASIVAPFTSLDKSLSSVLDVLREGRCALASTLSAYSYYIIYGQTETFLQVIMAYLSVTLSEWCWIFLDGIFSISLAFSIPLSRAAEQLTSRRPTDRLLGPETLFSVCGVLAWNFVFVILALVILFQQEWFQCRKWDNQDVSTPRDIGDNYEASVIFIVGGYQYVASAIVMNFGYTFRQPWYRNYLFVLLSATWSLLFIALTLAPSSFSCIWRVNCVNENVVRWVTTSEKTPINNPFNTTVMPVAFRFTLVFLMMANLVTIILWQKLFVNGYLLKRKEAMGPAVYEPQPVLSEQAIEGKAEYVEGSP